MSSLFIENSRPISLLLAVLTYALGTGIASYLGYKINWSAYWLGQIGITLLQLSSNYLKTYYDFPENSSRLLPSAETRLQKLALLQVSVTLMTIGAVFTVLLFANGSIRLPTLIVLGFALMIALFYGVPPLRLAYSGYGELFESIFIANLTPALAFLLQSSSLNRHLMMLTFPITALCLAMFLAISLITYADDLKYDRRTLMVRVGWQRGMNMHHLLIFSAYVLLGWGFFWGLPWSLIWQGFLTLPVGLLQIYQIARIAGGARPNWWQLKVNAISTVVLTTLLFAIILWLG